MRDSEKEPGLSGNNMPTTSILQEGVSRGHDGVTFYSAFLCSSPPPPAPGHSLEVVLGAAAKSKNIITKESLLFFIVHRLFQPFESGVALDLPVEILKRRLCSR